MVAAPAPHRAALEESTRVEVARRDGLHTVEPDDSYRIHGLHLPPISELSDAAASPANDGGIRPQRTDMHETERHRGDIVQIGYEAGRRHPDIDVRPRKRSVAKLAVPIGPPARNGAIGQHCACRLVSASDSDCPAKRRTLCVITARATGNAK